jgi:hypothetical protein
VSQDSGEPMRPWSRRALRYHLAFAPAICFCLAAGWFELHRAREGRTIAWVYAVEWPVFGVVFGFMWWHIINGRETRRPAPPPSDRAREIPDDDPGLVAWRAYLAELGHDDTSTDRAPGSG